MRLYEFLCDNLECKYSKERFTDWCKYEDIGNVRCPICGSECKKQLSLFNDQYKGEGFTRSATAKEEKDVWRDTRKSYF